MAAILSGVPDPGRLQPLRQGLGAAAPLQLGLRKTTSREGSESRRERGQSSEARLGSGATGSWCSTCKSNLRGDWFTAQASRVIFLPGAGLCSDSGAPASWISEYPLHNLLRCGAFIRTKSKRLRSQRTTSSWL